MLFFFFFTKSEEMSRVGSRGRHAGCRPKIGIHLSTMRRFSTTVLVRVRIPTYVQDLNYTGRRKGCILKLKYPLIFD